MIEAYERGDVAGALALHRRLLPLFTGIFRTQGTILVKAALNARGLPGRPGPVAAGRRHRRRAGPAARRLRRRQDLEAACMSQAHLELDAAAAAARRAACGSSRSAGSAPSAAT